MYKGVFFKFERRHSVTDMLHELGLPSFEEYYFMCVDRSQQSWVACLNSIVRHLCLVLC